MKKLLVFLIFQLVFISVFAQKKPAFIIYNAKGKKASYKKMRKALAKKDIVLFGEIHNSPIAHWLQFEITSDLHQFRQLILGAEMLEADNQKTLDKYMAGEIEPSDLDSLMKLWPNYDTDYAPLVDFAKEKQLPFVATNIPRKYANLVYKEGFEALDTLTTKEKEWIAPLPIFFDSELPTYKSILKLMGDHGTPELVKAQAMKDATMAHFISKNFKMGQLFIHFNGAFHSDFYEGILWYLKRGNSQLNYATISTVSQKNVFKLLKENKSKADFIICVDEDMTGTY